MMLLAYFVLLQKIAKVRGTWLCHSFSAVSCCTFFCRLSPSFGGGITLAPHTSTIRKMVRTNIGMMSTFVVRPAYGSNPSTSQRLLFGQMVQFNRFVKSPYSPCSIVTIFNCTIVLSHCCRHEKHVLVPFIYFC